MMRSVGRRLLVVDSDGSYYSRLFFQSFIMYCTVLLKQKLSNTTLDRILIISIRMP
jgi:hypothetical protein